MSEWIGRVFQHSCEQMPEIPNASVHACVTSPPYYALRDYGIEGQIGLEDTVEGYVGRLVAVFREVRRVLRDDGSAWLNLGDSYATTPVGAFNGGGPMLKGRNTNGHGVRTINKVKASGLKPKNLIGIPWRVAFALQADGWILRDAIVWHKPATMPSSVTDRCSPCYEMVFHLVKQARYYADMEAVREPFAESSLQRLAQDVENQEGSERANAGGKMNGTMKAVGDPARGGNLRNVWTIAPEQFSGEHFARFPRELARRCILIGAPSNGIVLDPFMGSGTTAEVAIGCGRRFVGYELNPEYHELIRDRLGLFGAA